MKIALVSPSQDATYGRLKAPTYPPLGLGYLGGVLSRKGDCVEILDMEAEHMNRENFRRWLSHGKPDLVGFTCTTPLYYEVLNLSRIVKEEIGSICIAGGMHPTLLPEEMLKDDIDFVIRGEGEETIVELVRILEKKGDLTNCPGLTFRRDGKVTSTLPRPLINNLDSLPFPHREVFRKFRYFYPDSRTDKCFPIITSRGCSGQCTFCCSQHIFTHRFRYRSARNVVLEIVELKERFGAREIHIWDDNFTLLKRRVFEIRDEVRRNKLKMAFAFPNGLRVDQVDEEILYALKEMGTYSISFGVESGNQKILDSVRKGIRIKDVKETFRLCKALGIETWAFFIIGLPGEDISTIKETINLARAISPDIAKFHILKPFPGSAIYNQLLSQNLIDDFNYEHFGIHTGPIHHLPNLSKEDMEKWQKKCYRSFYVRPKVLWNEISRLRTFYQLRSNLRTGLQLLREMLKR